MLVYSIIMFIVAVIFAGMGFAIFRGKTELIHDYHQTKVSDKSAYGRAFGKAMFIIATAMLISGIMGLFKNLAVTAVSILLIGLVIGICWIVAVQRKYNKELF